MVTITVTYENNLHCAAQHEPSGTKLATDAPKDNHGLGESFSPTDLVATALGSCLLTIMGIHARNLGIDINGATATVEKDMSAAPRRIAQLSVHVKIPQSYDIIIQDKLERAALACPVHKSLHPDINLPIIFHWGQN